MVNPTDDPAAAAAAAAAATEPCGASKEEVAQGTTTTSATATYTNADEGGTDPERPAAAHPPPLATTTTAEQEQEEAEDDTNSRRLPRRENNNNYHPRSVVAFSCARQQLDESLELIPEHEKAAYLHAIRTVPHLVELESNPEVQLEFAGGDPWKAAMRLAKYWRTRVEIFQDRAYLPLTLTGHGAMSKEDVEILNSGFFMELPPNKDGHTVLFHDRSRLPPSSTLDIKIRCLFYVLSAVAESDTNRRHGIVILTSYGDKTRKSTFDSSHSAKGIALIHQEVLPIRVVGGHLVMMSQRPLLNVVVPMTIQILERLNFLTSQVTVYKYKRLELQRQELQDNGFDLEGIPKVPMGGLYSFGCFKRWLEDRHRRDSHLYGGGTDEFPAAAAAAAIMGVGATTTMTTTTMSVGTGQGDDPCDNTTFQRETEESKRKDADAAYARRKRHRKRIELEVMQEQVERLQRQNRRLKDTGQELEGRLTAALVIVDAHHNNHGGIDRAVPTATLTAGAAATLLPSDVSASVSLPSHPSLASQLVAASAAQDAADALDYRRREAMQFQRLGDQGSAVQHAQLLQLSMAAAASNPSYSQLSMHPSGRSSLYGPAPPSLPSHVARPMYLDPALFAVAPPAAGPAGRTQLLSPPLGVGGVGPPYLSYAGLPHGSLQTAPPELPLPYHRTVVPQPQPPEAYQPRLGGHPDDHPTLLQRLYEYLSRG